VLGIPSQGIDRSLPASRRHALVIGNGSYQNVTALPNAVADARLVADVLRQSGYLVQYYEDLTKRGFENALRSMLLDVSRGSEIVIYYAGHGVQVGGSNRLIPVDAAISSVYDIPFETVSLSSILSIAGSRARSLVVIMDSCRDNPFPAQEGIVGLDPVPETLRTGFTAQDTPINSLLVFSTSPGAKALDGDGANSPFTLALHDVAMANPKAPLPDMLRKVRARVYNQTGGLQLPWESSSLIEEVSLDLEPGLAVVASDSSLVPPDAGKVVEITLPLEPKVALGEALRTAMGASSISLSQVPHGGRLEVSDGTRFRGLSLLPISSDQISSMVYSGNRLENLAKSMEEPRFTDTFQVTADGLLQTVELTLEVDPCDLEAGNYLDPDGVGVARYANEIEPEVALPACQAAIARSPQTGRFHYQLGRVLLAMGDLDGAEEAFNKSLALNHTRAWQALGLLEIQRLQAKGGATRPRAPETAMAKLAIGVEVGDPYAFHTLGQLLLEQETDPALKLRGFELMLRAMEVGHTFSMNALGAYFLKKDSPQYDPTRGVRYYKESAARNDIYGYDNMGFAAQEGIGDVAKDPKAALEWFTRAADAGHPTSPSNIGRMYQGNAFGAPDLPEAIRWFDIGLLRGDGWGGANAAWIIAGKQPRGFDIADAATRAAKASVLNNQGARQSADELLAKMPAKALDAGAQKLMSELGEETVADGAFGPGSKEALTRIAVQFDTAIPDDRLDRLKTLARIYWTTRHLRVDLF
jgi:TPR repeat protein